MDWVKEMKPFVDLRNVPPTPYEIANEKSQAIKPVVNSLLLRIKKYIEKTDEQNYSYVHHSYCHINLVKKTVYQWDIVKVGIYILYLPSEIHVQKYLEEPKKIFHLIFSFNSISKSRTTSNCIIKILFLDVVNVNCNLEFIKPSETLHNL